MKRQFIFTIVYFLSITFCIPAFAGSTDSSWTSNFDWQMAIASRPTKTVEDYFLLLPAEILDCENTSKGFQTLKERKALIRKSDVRNGYLSFFKTAQIAIFKNREKSYDIIAIQIGKSGSGSTCGGINRLLQFNSNTKTWRQRDDLLPRGFIFEDLYNRLSDKDILPYFLLPQKGLEIKIQDESKDSTISIIKWNGKEFLLHANPAG
jgi:hypothetical protein